MGEMTIFRLKIRILHAENRVLYTDTIHIHSSPLLIINNNWLLTKIWFLSAIHQCSPSFFFFRIVSFHVSVSMDSLHLHVIFYFNLDMYILYSDFIVKDISFNLDMYILYSDFIVKDISFNLHSEGHIFQPWYVHTLFRLHSEKTFLSTLISCIYFIQTS